MEKYTEYLKQITDLLWKSAITLKDGSVLAWNDGFDAVVKLFFRTRDWGKNLFFIGNGGSAAIADHMTADFMKNGRMKTVGITNNALTTCMGNDYGYESVFMRPLDFLAEEGDLLVAISSSGSSLNIAKAVETAKRHRTEVVTLTGFREDNRLRGMGDFNIYVPAEHYGMVESIHNLLLQQIADIMAEGFVQ